jgi:non-ribosomal peptide synthetase component F
MPQALRFPGELDHGALERALGEITRRHEALRTTFHEADGDDSEAVQRILPTAPFHLPAVDLGDLGAAAEAEALRLAGEEAMRPFDLVHGPLLRVVLLRLSPADRIVAITMHHIVSDGWSMNVFAHEVTALYAAFRAGLPSPLPELPLQYRDYTLWQRRRLTGGVLEAELAFWREELRGLPARLDLPADRPRPPAQSFRGLSLVTKVGEETVAGLRGVARDRESTLFMVLLAAFQTLLGRLAGTADLAVGVPVSGRNRQELEGLIGFQLPGGARRLGGRTAVPRRDRADAGAAAHRPGAPGVPLRAAGAGAPARAEPLSLAAVPGDALVRERAAGRRGGGRQRHVS